MNLEQAAASGLVLFGLLLKRCVAGLLLPLLLLLLILLLLLLLLLLLC